MHIPSVPRPQKTNRCTAVPLAIQWESLFLGIQKTGLIACFSSSVPGCQEMRNKRTDPKNKEPVCSVEPSDSCFKISVYVRTHPHACHTGGGEQRAVG